MSLIGKIKPIKFKLRSPDCYWVRSYLITTVHKTVHIEDFTRARVNESDLTAVLVETGAIPVPTKSQNPTACGRGGLFYSY